MSTHERTASEFSQDADGEPPPSPGADGMIDKALDVQREWTNLIISWRLAPKKEEEAANIVQKMMSSFLATGHDDALDGTPGGEGVNPKKDQSSEITKKAIQAKVFPSKIGLKIKGVKKIKKGGIAINTDLKEDIEKLIEEFKKIDEIVNNNEIIKPLPRKPRIVIYGVDNDLTKEEVQENLVSQNNDMTTEGFAVLSSFQGKQGKNWITQLNPDVYQRIKDRDRLNIVWTRLKFREYLRVMQCYKCFRYGHIRERCRNDESCVRCGKGHRSTNCEKDMKCRNCSFHNSIFATKFKTDHLANDTNCKIRSKEIEVLRSQIDYGQ
ncbi:hypothetical protein AVEN_152201-1 [Araneus ventricosus]|uniref:CCHC-type domain-containing protein n=1 Tax=Araneus ventricosus TaxID=182803 RepID=A0A4Y2HKZ1_ARAVE|nr:hypothetical protein AVEN_152201-1 [Araneus ventricosus]